MACVAVLIPCHNGSAEVLPGNVSADDVLQGPLLCTRLEHGRRLHWSAVSFNSQVNEVATAAVGFMVHGDALITQSTGPEALAADLLAEVQASMDQLSDFNTDTRSKTGTTRRHHKQPQEHPKNSLEPAKTARAITVPTAKAAQSQVHHALRHRRHTVLPIEQPDSPDSSLPADKAFSSQATAAPESDLFQSPQLPGIEQSVTAEQHVMADVKIMPLVDMWASMQSELLGNILQQVQWTSREAVALTAVCRSWRQIISSDQHFLKSIQVNINPKAPLQGSQLLCECCRGMSIMVQQARHRQLPLPRVIHKAASGGNIFASVCVAQIMDGRGDTSAALKFWSKAAKLNHPEAQFRLGRACYEGVGVAADAQDALLWLGRASKTLLAEDLSVESISNTSTASLLARRIRMQRDRQQGGINHSRAVFNTEVSMPEEQVLAKTALLLGFLHLDGEATKFDAAEALKWFKVALLNDCAEAARIIGTLFNTGQYG